MATVCFVGLYTYSKFQYSELYIGKVLLLRDRAMGT
jgi:hypothetical protein